MQQPFFCLCRKPPGYHLLVSQTRPDQKPHAASGNNNWESWCTLDKQTLQPRRGSALLRLIDDPSPSGNQYDPRVPLRPAFARMTVNPTLIEDGNRSATFSHFGAYGLSWTGWKVLVPLYHVLWEETKTILPRLTNWKDDQNIPTHKEIVLLFCLS